MSGFFSLFPSIMLPMFLAMVDGTTVSAALPAITGELGETQRISWIVIAYLIAATVASPVHGRLGDSFGRKRLMYVALVIIVVATVLCGVAPNVDLLIAARVLQGLGGGGLMTLSQALILERGADALASISAEQIAAIEAEIGTAFRVAFFTIAAFVAAATVLAWSIPLRRI